jgi:ComF family protein
MTSLFKYRGLLRKIIKNSKYRLAYKILQDFIKSLGPEHIQNLLEMKKSLSGALIQPIPLSFKRLKARGFNQSTIIGKYLSWALGLKMADYMVRKYDNTPQAELRSVERRYQNVKGIFGLRPGVKIKGKTILLVDDVATSGATIKEAASVLKRFGVLKVFAFTLAKG